MPKVLEVHVTNRHATFKSQCDSNTLGSLYGFWSYSDPAYHFITQRKPSLRLCRYCGKFEHETADHAYEPKWDGRTSFIENDTLPAGLFWATRKEIEQALDIKFKVTADLERPAIKEGLSSNREYQNECVEAMLRTMRFGGGLIIGATGTGKTRMAGMFFSRVKGYGLFVVDQLILLKQAREEIAKVMNEEIGIVGNSEFEPKRITIATIQTMFKHRKKSKFMTWTNQLEVILIDEIHEMMARRNFFVVSQIEPLACFGLTATLQLKKKPVKLKAHALTGPVVFTYDMAQGIQEGVLTQGLGIRVIYPNPLSVALQKAEGFGKLYADKIVNNKKRNELVSSLVELGHTAGRYVIVLVNRISHLKTLSDRLKHIPHRVVCGTYYGKNIKVEERIDSKLRFEAGQIRLILANTVFKKGVDTKRLDMIIDASAARSENDPVQKFGRGVRKHEDKAGLLYFDINDWDDRNSKNYFYKASRYRTRALQRAGIQLVKIEWDGSNQKQIFDNAVKKLNQILA